MKYLIIANGPFLPKQMIQKAAENACIIALDGAANKLFDLNILPNIILGDMDSITQQIWPNGIEIISALDQNFTDFQKALRLAKNRHATSIHLVCAIGGRIDHELAVFQTLKSEHNVNCPIYLHAEFQSITFAKDQVIEIKGKHNDYCGLFGFPTAMMTVKNGGLKYGGEKPYALSSEQYSVSNRLVGDDGAIVEIVGDALVVHPLMLTIEH